MKENKLVDLTFDTITPNEAYSLACIYAGQQGVKVILSDTVKEFCCDPKEKIVYVPNKTIKVQSLESYIQGLRHEGYHIRHTAYEIPEPKKGEDALIHIVKQPLEDVRIDVEAERDYLGGKMLNEKAYSHPNFQIDPKETTPTLSTYIYALKRRGIFPNETLPFTLEPRLEEISLECRDFPTNDRMVELITEATDIIRKLYKDQIEEIIKLSEEFRKFLEELKKIGMVGKELQEVISKYLEKESKALLLKEIKNAKKEYEDAEKGTRNLLGSEFIEVEKRDYYLQEEDKEQLLELVKQFSMQKGAEQGIELNRNPVEIAIGLEAGNTDLIFAAEDVEEEQQEGTIVLCLDLSGSMKNTIIGKIQKQTIAMGVCSELADMETGECKFEIYGFSGDWSQIKRVGTSLTFKELSTLCNKQFYVGGSTNPSDLIVHLSEKYEADANVLYIWITDGHWDYYNNSYQLYESKFLMQNRRTSIIFICYAHDIESFKRGNAFPAYVVENAVGLDVEGKNGFSKMITKEAERLAESML